MNLRLAFPGHSADPRVVASNPRSTRMNYLLGSDPGRWRRGVHTWGLVTWSGLYPGISVRLAEAGGHPVLAVKAAPGADPPALRLRVEGAGSVRATPEGLLVAVGDALPRPSRQHPGRG